MIVAAIPARYGSTRFPGKPLAMLAGKPMVQWVYERAAATRCDAVVVATDDERIAACVRGFGGVVAMTSAAHETGTDRIAEAVRGMGAELVVNVQGDEPLVPPEVIDALVARMLAGEEAAMGTVAVPFAFDDPELRNPHVVKVVTDAAGFALYFSRAPIPWDRDGGCGTVRPLRHWGIYAYRREFLERFVAWPPGRLEQCERLEQLRALENGARIAVIESDRSVIGVDVPEDLARAEAALLAGGGDGAGRPEGEPARASSAR